MFFVEEMVVIRRHNNSVGTGGNASGELISDESRALGDSVLGKCRDLFVVATGELRIISTGPSDVVNTM